MSDLKTFTIEEIEKSEGALVVVDGKVYDVSESKLWPGGKHMNAHRAGGDLSAEIKAAPHGLDVLERVTLVGEIAEPAPEPEAAPRPPALVSMILSKHPHPVSVHFPIALSIAGALFMIAGALFGIEALEKAGFYNVLFAAVSAPGAIGAGLLSWWFNYGHASTPIFRKKILLSVIYMLVAPAACALYILLPDDATMQWVALGLVAALPPMAMGLGFLGGKITFPA